MTRTIGLGLAALALMAASGCNRETAPGGTAQVDTAAIEQQLRDNETKWNAAYAARDVETLAAIYADDGSVANPGAPLITESAARHKMIADFVADPNLKLVFAADRVGVAASGDLAYTRGHFTLTMTNAETKKPEDMAGNYLTVWKKQADGSWKAVEDFITPGAPAAEAGAAPAGGGS